MQIDLRQALSRVLAVHDLQLLPIAPPFEALRRFDYGLRASLDPQFDWQQFGRQLLDAVPEGTLLLAEDTFGLHFALFRIPDGDAPAFVAGPWRTAARTAAQRGWVRRNLGAGADNSVEEYFNGVLLSPNAPFVGAMAALLETAMPDGTGTPRLQVSIVKELVPLRFQPSLSAFSRPEFREAIPMSMLEQRYRCENRLMDAVARGDERLALAALEQSKRFRYRDGRLQGSLAQRKWALIIINTLLRKSIERAKIHPYYIDRISERYARGIEMAREEDVQALLVEMVRGYCACVREYSLYQYSPVIQKVVNYINLNLSGPLSLKMLAEMHFISPSYLSSLFRQEVGATLTEYVNTRRVRRAQALLAHTDGAVSDIAVQVGIQDVNYFTKIFKRITGTTPSRYRRGLRAEETSTPG